MSEDLHANIENYKLQLQQVEAALVAESDNEELKKLKADLEEVIKITQELLYTSADGSPAVNGAEIPVDEPKPVKEWKVGDRCMAVWSKNNQLYEAVIDGISEGKAAVTFVGYNVTEINKLHQLRICEQIQPKKYLWDTKPKAKSQWQVEKERRRRKALKKFQRLKQIEEDKEAEKNKWKEFTAKASAKSYKGLKKDSIFASPETTMGRVGVGTCGVSGKPMTDFQQQEKYVAGKVNYSLF